MARCSGSQPSHHVFCPRPRSHSSPPPHTHTLCAYLCLGARGDGAVQRQPAARVCRAHSLRIGLEQCPHDVRVGARCARRQVQRQLPAAPRRLRAVRVQHEQSLHDVGRAAAAARVVDGLHAVGQRVGVLVHRALWVRDQQVHCLAPLHAAPVAAARHDARVGRRGLRPCGHGRGVLLVRRHHLRRRHVGLRR
eukprot:353200-Chlamydomonas_euryale.AAC.2